MVVETAIKPCVIRVENTKTPQMRSFYVRQARQAWVLPGGCSQHSDRSLKRFELPVLYQQVLYLSLVQLYHPYLQRKWGKLNGVCRVSDSGCSIYLVYLFPIVQQI